MAFKIALDTLKQLKQLYSVFDIAYGQNTLTSFWIDACHESSKVDEMINGSIMKVPFIQNQIERILAEANFTNNSRTSVSIFVGNEVLL